MNISRTILVSMVALSAVGCIETTFPTATGKGTVRSLNAAVTTPDVTFLIEERVIGQATFKELTASREFDDLDYNINFDYRFTGDTAETRLTSTPFTLLRDTDYLFIFTGSLATPGSLTWDFPTRAWDGAETVMHISFGHLSPQLGEVDMYFAAPGTAPVLGEALATLTNGNRSPVIELPEGDYEYIITSKDNPADILFNSTTINYQAQTDFLIATFDSDPSITSAVSARVMNLSGVSTELADINSPPTLRTLHSAISVGPFDLYREMDFTTPWIANVDYGTVSAAVETPPDVATYTYTDAGNIGSIILEEDFPVVPGHHTTRYLLGSVLNVTTLTTVDNIRPLEDTARFRFVQTSTNQTAVDIYLVEDGVDIDDVPPRFFNLAFLGNTEYFDVRENDYDVYITLPATKDILAGPFAITAANGDIVHFAIIDNVDPSIVDIFNYDHLSVTP